MTHSNCTLILGQGRSGTNWLLDLLDLSPYTHCRNEPNELSDSPFTALPAPALKQVYGPSFGPSWNQAIASAAMQMGMRDRIAANPKVYLRWRVSRLGGAYLLSGQRRRQIASLLIPEISGEQWPVPAWIADRQRLEQARLVLKINQAPGWAAWVLNHRPQSTVVHIVRHPGGFLNSWRNRYVDSRAVERVKQDNLNRLKMLAASSPAWSRRMGNLNTMSVDELELWYWRYANEVVYQAGQGRANYVLVVYEDLVQNPVRAIKRVYVACGLPWTEDIEAKVLSRIPSSQAIASAWKDQLTPEQSRLVESVLAPSPLADQWQPPHSGLWQKRRAVALPLR